MIIITPEKYKKARDKLSASAAIVVGMSPLLTVPPLGRVGSRVLCIRQI